jgi:hypothetical protein
MDAYLGAVMVPGGWANRTAVVPPPRPVPGQEVGVFPQARRDGRHVPGAEAKGGRARYWDLNGFVWYSAGGMLTLNRGQKRIRRTSRGVEDATHAQG